VKLDAAVKLWFGLWGHAGVVGWSMRFARIVHKDCPNGQGNALPPRQMRRYSLAVSLGATLLSHKTPFHVLNVIAGAYTARLKFARKDIPAR